MKNTNIQPFCSTSVEIINIKREITFTFPYETFTLVKLEQEGTTLIVIYTFEDIEDITSRPIIPYSNNYSLSAFQNINGPIYKVEFRSNANSSKETPYEHKHKPNSFENTDFSKKIEVEQFSKKSISTQQFLKIKEKCPFTNTEWAAYLDVSLKTLQRYTKDDMHIFKSSQAEKMIELLEVMNFGNTVFDTSQQFHSWLKTPNYALGKSKPIDLIKNPHGKELVMDALYSIENGIFV